MRIIGSVASIADNGLLIRGDIDTEALQNRIDKCGAYCEITMHDNRLISRDQRKKIYATFKDIADFMGEYTFSGEDYVKNFLKGTFLEATKEEKGYNWFSLSDCSMELACDFTTFLIDFCFEHHIPTLDTLGNRFADMESYFYMCLKHRRCAVCNDPGEIHHIDVIGMGNNRRRLDDSAHRKICLCRAHHIEVETIGWSRFAEKYHVDGILYMEAA